MNNSNYINTPLHVVNFVAPLSNFANDRNLVFTFCGAARLGDEQCVEQGCCVGNPKANGESDASHSRESQARGCVMHQTS